MPIYEYVCPKCGIKFDVMKSIPERETNGCPKCGTVSQIVPSMFTHYWFNPFTVDGEGFTSKYLRPEEREELNAECRNR